MASMSKAKAENRALPKRFYERAETRDGQILLDGRVLKTSAKNPLHVAQHTLAEAIAAEWEAQIDVVNPDAMPLTRLMNIAIDRVPQDRDALLDDIVRFAETDLLCYRAGHAELAAKQAKLFNPVLDWAARAHGIELDVTDGMMPIPQPADSLHRVRALTELATDHQLAALALMTPLVGSAILALAYWQGAIDTNILLAAAHLDEDFQAAQWGEDSEAKAAWKARARDISAAAFFLDTQGTEKQA